MQRYTSLSRFISKFSVFLMLLKTVSLKKIVGPPIYYGIDVLARAVFVLSLISKGKLFILRKFFFILSLLEVYICMCMYMYIYLNLLLIFLFLC